MIMLPEDLDKILWENYYFLATTRAQAMEAMWGDFANGTLVSWALDSWGLTSDDILRSFARLTVAMLGTDVNEEAYKPHA